MPREDFVKLPINELLAKAAEVLDDILEGIPDAKQDPEWGAMLLALRERSKDVFSEGDIFAPKDTFDPGKG
jgi:hypothetical protein